jgi:hypothetical protein
MIVLVFGGNLAASDSRSVCCDSRGTASPWEYEDDDLKGDGLEDDGSENGDSGPLGHSFSSEEISPERPSEAGPSEKAHLSDYCFYVQRKIAKSKEFRETMYRPTGDPRRPWKECLVVSSKATFWDDRLLSGVSVSGDGFNFPLICCYDPMVDVTRFYVPLNSTHCCALEAQRFLWNKEKTGKTEQDIYVVAVPIGIARETYFPSLDGRYSFITFCIKQEALRLVVHEFCHQVIIPALEKEGRKGKNEVEAQLIILSHQVELRSLRTKMIRRTEKSS